jgi:sulfur carrier protein
VSALVNGEPRPVVAGTTVAGLIEELGHDPSGRGVAAALNGEVVPRTEWPTTGVGDGDKVEILTAIGGG